MTTPLTKAEKKAQKKAEHEAKVKAEAEAKAQASQQGPTDGGSSEQGPGQDVAGEKSGEASGASAPRTTQEDQSSHDTTENSESDAFDKEKKVHKVNCNLFHNGREFHKDQAISSHDKDYKELKKLGFLN